LFQHLFRSALLPSALFARANQRYALDVIVLSDASALKICPVS
jgi:hypothetical protein